MGFNGIKMTCESEGKDIMAGYQKTHSERKKDMNEELVKQTTITVAERMGKPPLEVTAAFLTLDLDKGNRTILTTDWHLWIKDRTAKFEPKPVYFRPNAEEILEQYYNLKESDVLIHVGDLVDDEFYAFFSDEEQDAIFDSMFSEIKPKTRFLVLGNNDPPDKVDLFKKHGWIPVDYALVDEKYFVTHMPMNLSEIDKDVINIHGHSHGHGYYWQIPFYHHLDIWDKDRRPITFTAETIDELYAKYCLGIKDISNFGFKTKQEFTSYLGRNLKGPDNI